MLNVNIRPATSTDVESITRLVHDAYAHYVERIGGLPGQMRADYAAVVAGGQTWVAEDQHRIVGVLVLERHADHLLIENVAVDPAAQRSGIGARLLAHAERVARDAGLGELRLYTHVLMTENQEYYLRKGFVETARLREGWFERVFFSQRLPGGS